MCFRGDGRAPGAAARGTCRVLLGPHRLVPCVPGAAQLPASTRDSVWASQRGADGTPPSGQLRGRGGRQAPRATSVPWTLTDMAAPARAASALVWFRFLTRDGHTVGLKPKPARSHVPAAGSPGAASSAGRPCHTSGGDARGQAPQLCTEAPACPQTRLGPTPGSCFVPGGLAPVPAPMTVAKRTRLAGPPLITDITDFLVVSGYLGYPQALPAGLSPAVCQRASGIFSMIPLCRELLRDLETLSEGVLVLTPPGLPGALGDRETVQSTGPASQSLSDTPENLTPLGSLRSAKASAERTRPSPP